MGAFFDEGFVKGRAALLAGPARSDGGGRKAQKREETVDFGRDRPGVAGGARSGGEVADRAVGKSRARRSHERRRRPRICPLVRQDGLEIAWKGPALCAQTSDEGSIRFDERGAERAGRDLHVLDDGEEIRIRDRVEKAEGVRPVRRNSELRRQTGRSDGRRQAGPAHRRHRAVPLSGPREIGTDETLGENGHRSRAEMLEGILGGRERSSSVDDEAVGHNEKIDRQVRIEGRDEDSEAVLTVHADADQGNAKFHRSGPVTNPASRDAMLLITLAPGNYTAQISPVAGSAGGTAIVEVYEVP